MGKFLDSTSAILAIFDTPAWKLTGIKTVPADVVLSNLGDTFIRVDVLASGSGINLKSVSGILVVDIFTPAGSGPRGPLSIADTLDGCFVGKSVQVTSGAVQLYASSFAIRNLDKDNPTLRRSVYEIPFKFFGAS